MGELEAIYFMWKRELLRFLRSKSRIIGSLGTPILFLAVLGTGLNGLAMSGLHTNYLNFIAPGILAMVLLTASIFSGVIVIMDRQFGFLKETLVAPVSRTSIVVGKALGGATTAMIQGCLMLIIAVLLGAQIEISSILVVLFLMFIISLIFVLIGIAIASTIEDMHGFQLIMNFLVMPMFFLSGALFPLNSAPDLMKYASYIDPLTYAVEALRFFLIGQASISIFTSFSVLFGFLVASLLLAVYLFGKIES